MKIRKLLLPTLIAAALATPTAFAQSADAKDQDHSQHQGHSAASQDKAKADATKVGDRKDARQDKGKAKKDAKSAKEQPDEPEEEGR